MDTLPPRDLRLRIPGFRRYARKIEGLRRDATELDALRARLGDAERAVRASRGLAPGNDMPTDDEEWSARAKTFEYYWVNAHKKIDVLSTRPFGPIAMEVLRDGRTYLNADRLYTLWQAVTRMPATATSVAEVGAFKVVRPRSSPTRCGLHTAGFASTYATPLRVAVVDPAIDGRHHGQVWFRSPRVVLGATIVVDDYGFTTCRGVKKAVDEFVARSGRFWAMPLLTARAVLTRIA